MPGLVPVQNRIFRLIGWIFAGGGLLLLVVGTLLFLSNRSKLARYMPATATISSIRRGTGSDDSPSAYLDYEVNGRRFTDVRSNVFSSSMREGDALSIACDPDDPSQFIVTGSYTYLASSIFWGVGGIHFLIGTALLVLTRRKKPPDPEPGSEYLL